MDMKTIIISIIALAASCTWASAELNHPCLLHTEADFEYTRNNIGIEPYSSALTKLKNSQYCKPTYKPNPVEYLARLDATNWSELNWRWENAGIADLWYQGIHNNYTNFMRDAAAAYQLALLYKIENNTNAAEASKNIMLEWSKLNKGILRNKNGELIDPNEKLIMFQPYQMAAAAEMLRNYNNWGKSEEFGKVASWLDEAFYPVCHEHLELQNTTGGGHYWMNWDLASMTSILAIGILTDNDAYISEAINYYKGQGGGPGNIEKGVPFLHLDDDSLEFLGQGNELGRDQGHNTLCAALLGTFCQMALSIGEDLFAYDNYRALAFAEYVAKYNLAHEELYPNPMQNFPSMVVGQQDDDYEYAHSSFPFTPYTYGDGGTMREPSSASRGQVRPGWDYWVGYANAHGKSAIYSSMMAERIRPDGGGGQYSTNSGGFDQIGFSTLMGYREAEEDNITETVELPCIGDTWVREDLQNVNNGTTEKIELRRVDIKDADGNVSDGFHVGLIGFRFALPDGKEVEEATLRLVTERVKGNEVSLYAYSNHFDEATANWNSEKEHIASVEEPLLTFTAAGHKEKSIYDSGIRQDCQNLEAWTNEIDLTEYFTTLSKDCNRVNFLLKQNGNQVCFFSKETKGQGGAFNGTSAQTDLRAEQLMPRLTVIYKEKGHSSATETIFCEQESTEYYNLMGMRIQNPSRGNIYIVKRGCNVFKQVF